MKSHLDIIDIATGQLDRGTVGLPQLRSSAECPALVADLIPISGSQEYAWLYELISLQDRLHVQP